jgi:hypothetical protein
MRLRVLRVCQAPGRNGIDVGECFAAFRIATLADDAAGDAESARLVATGPPSPAHSALPEMG